jgi:hypothetical protein
MSMLARLPEEDTRRKSYRALWIATIRVNGLAHDSAPACEKNTTFLPRDYSFAASLARKNLGCLRTRDLMYLYDILTSR